MTLSPWEPRTLDATLRGERSAGRNFLRTMESTKPLAFLAQQCRPVSKQCLLAVNVTRSPSSSLSVPVSVSVCLCLSVSDFFFLPFLLSCYLPANHNSERVKFGVTSLFAQTMTTGDRYLLPRKIEIQRREEVIIFPCRWGGPEASFQI